MENEIRRGTYVTLDYYGCSSEVPITQALYSMHYGKIGLVRLVKYVGGASRQVAEVIFSGVPYGVQIWKYSGTRDDLSNLHRSMEVRKIYQFCKKYANKCLL